MKALISVSDKRGVVEFATALNNMGWEIIATGGTMRMLLDSGLSVTGISEVTGFPEICGGRVKTLHPKVHGALLGRRDNEDDMKQLAENGIGLIDMVVVNLYPFEATVAKEGVTLADAIENIDIGGPSMLRSAAKNCKSVTVVCDPDDYSSVIEEIASNGNTLAETRLRLSAKAYTHTALYDSHIAEYMRRQAGLPEKLFLDFDEVQGLRYGENPHQAAKFYRTGKEYSYSVATARQIQGKELSYNNIQDANAALEIVSEFDKPFCVGLKHMNPCGAAVGADVLDAWTRAYEADKVSIYGGMLNVLNHRITLIFLHTGFSMAMSVFMFHGFINGNIPIALEEAAYIDGCTHVQTFFKIVFPLLRPIISTMVILNSLAFWNDFLLPSLVLTDKELLTLPLSTYSFYGTYSADYGTIMAGLLLCVAPILILYVVLQKQIIGGVVAGAVK